MGKMYRVPDSILDLIGNTPLVPIKKLNQNPDVRVFAKLEMFNPSGSVKARPALKMIEAAEQDGSLTRDKIILEATSGNTGIGLALVAAVKGYRIMLAMSEAVSEERRKILAALGAKFLLTPPELGTDGAIDVVYRTIRRQPDRYFVPDQYNNPNNPLSHYEGTAVEIWNQTGGEITHFVASIGTTGTVVGTGRRLKEFNPNVQIIAVEPYLNHRIQGLKNLKEAYKPGIWDKSVVDKKINIRDEDAFETTRRLASEEGLFVGMSSGAAMYVALQLAKQLDHGTIVAIMPDGGERYLSTQLFALAVPVKPVLNLRLYNALSRRVETFSSEREIIRIYACGPTAYAPIHLGLARRIVVADLLRRFIESSGFSTKVVMNVTDIDDKTIEAARKQGVSLSELTRRYIDMFLEDIESLRVKPPAKLAKATDSVEDMVQLTQLLIDKGVAYEKLRSVYFDISKVPDYGVFSGLDLTKIKVGKTVDLDDYEKNDPKDFTLLKRATLADLKDGVFYETKWGNVRPSWHIQCAAISTRYLGQQYDIHVSGIDLIFPHHENTLAIGKAAYGKSPAKYWVLTELVYTDGKKMSRSSGSDVAVRELLKQGYTGRQLRYFLIKTHYRKPLLFSKDNLDAACSELDAWDRFIRRVAYGCFKGSNIRDEVRDLIKDLEAGFSSGIGMDLNVSLAMSYVHAFRKAINRIIYSQGITQGEADLILDGMRKVNEVLDIFEIPTKAIPVEDEVVALAKKRIEAKKKKDFALSDRLREEIKSKGFNIIDLPDGFVFDPVDIPNTHNK